MALFKFICNFGVNLDSRNVLINGYKKNILSLQKSLLNIPTMELLLVI